MRTISSSLSESNLPSLVESLVAALLAGDEAGALQVVSLAPAAGLGHVEIAESLILAAHARVGLAWHKGDITVAHEHRASHLVLRCLEKAKDLADRQGSHGRQAAVLCVEGDNHWLAARAIANVLETQGWFVSFLGENVPVSSVKAFFAEGVFRVVVVSATPLDSTDALKQTIKSLQDVPGKPLIIAGGYAAANLKEASKYYVSSLSEAVQKCSRLLEEEGVATNLDRWLEKLARNLVRLRKSKGMTQTDLAEAASIDRSYIGSVEKGKQNVSLAAVVKIAEALGVAPQDLLE